MYAKKYNSTQHTAHSTQHTAHSTQHTVEKYSNKNILILLFSIFLIFYNSVIAQTFSASINPDQSGTFCPGVTNNRTFVITINSVTGNTTADSVTVFGETKLTITNKTISNNTQITCKIWFDDQNLVIPSFRIKHSRVTANEVSPIQFPKVWSLAQRNVFPVTASNQLNIQVPICTQNVNINFTKMRYLVAGSDPNNSNNYFEDVNAYQYVLPSGVVPVSGLTPVVGLPNYYTGSNAVTVQVTSAFNSATIQVRGISTTCNNVSPSNFNNINLQRQLPTLNGPNSIRCGETDTKTFQVVNLPTTNNCITTYTWQIANKGWKYNGTIPTNNIVTTTPNIQLVSADNLNNPPQSVSVVIANATNQSYTATRNVTFIAPSITINPILSANFDCNALDFTANVINPPLSSFNYIWSSTGAPGSSFINFLPAPQTTITNTATISRDPNYTDPISINSAVNASCGIIYSSFYSGFNGCFPWSSFTVYGFTDPLNGGGNIVANIQGIPEATEYEWFSFYYNQYHYLTNTYGDYLQVSGYGFPSVDEIGIFVRAKTPSGNTELKFVGSFCNSSGCGGYRTAINGNNNANQIKVFPNPANTIVTVSLQTKILIANSTIDDELSMKVAKLSSKKEVISKKNSPLQHLPTEITQIKVMNSIGLMQKVVRFGKGNKTVDFSVNDLKDGIYMLEITDGKNTSKTPLIIKR